LIGLSLLDFQGSPVILESKSMNNQSNKQEQKILLLGIYSGIRNDNHRDKGVVFYGNFIEEIINEGINCFESNFRKTPPTC
jgi:hypothetical protein